MADSDGEIDAFLKDIDPGLCAYKQEFMSLAVHNENTMRFLRPNEVYGMSIPEVYKRMLVDRIINLQTPDTKARLKNEKISRSPGVELAAKHQPKKLKFDDGHVEVGDENKPNPKTHSDGFLIGELERPRDEKDTLTILLTHKKEELVELKRRPQHELKPLGILGNPIDKCVCDKCHHKGHRANRNKGNKSCPYDPCEGFQVCGIETKHVEHKQAVSEVCKEVINLEKRMKTLDDEIGRINTFVRHNTTNFISALRPCLKAHFPGKYMGHHGTQLMQKDLRFLKIACGGKVPSDMQKSNLEYLINKGKLCVSSTTPATSCDSETSVPPLPDKTPTAPSSVVSASLSTNYSSVDTTSPMASTTSPLSQVISMDNMRHVSPSMQMMPNWGYFPNQQYYQPWGGFSGLSPYMYHGWESPSGTPTSTQSYPSSCPSGDIFPPLPQDDPTPNPPLPDQDE